MTQATNLEQSINLYRMDANENVEMLVGDANKTFPDGGSTGLGSGDGNNMNQYTWQTAVHEGKMYLSTMNTTTLLEPIAQFTNGDILHMSAQEWKDTVKYLRAFLEILLKRDDTAAFSRTRSVRPSADDPDALVEWACRQASERAAADTPAQIDGDGGTQEEVALTDAQRESLVKGIKDGGIVPESLDDANTAGELFAINGALSSLAPQLDEQASEGFVDSYGDLLAALGALPQVPENLKKLYETLLKLASKQNMQAFFKSLPYLAKSKRGFNLFEISEDAQGGVAVASDNTFVMPSHSNRAGLHRQQHLCGRQPAVGRPRVHRCIDHRPGDGRSQAVLDVFCTLYASGQSIVMVTHDRHSALRANRVLFLRDGTIAGECALGAWTSGEPYGEREHKLAVFLDEMGW